MGNQLVSSVKTVIRPIDYYLNEVQDIKYKQSLGQTQFLKVALCTHNEGDIVVKVLSHEDPSLLLEQYKNDLINLSKLSMNNVSIASFRIFEIRTNFAYMARQYVRYSLYDRLSTRPFMTDIEKAWIIYQLLRCIQWCHNYQIFHGDLKLENILITSNLWVILSDFASYKPIRLPEDNPTFFNYFFDTSRRRCCNIAPERFVSSSSSSQNIQNNNNNGASFVQQQNANIFNLFLQEGQLTSKMDMFSIGCILAEIYSDNFLFDLSGILEYKSRQMPDNYMDELLERIQNESIQNIVRNLINLDPKQRYSCDEVINNLFSNDFFPPYFDELYILMNNLIRLPPDAKILYLLQNIDHYLDIIQKYNSKGLLIILMTITSSIRSLKHIYCKIESQRLICYIIQFSSTTLSPFIIDRLIPYLVNCLNDDDHRVRGESIDSITLLLEHVVRLPSSDNNLFTDYLMEKFQKCIINEKNIFVRMCMARNIGRLSKIALDFLNQYCDQNYDEELNLLHRYFQNLVSLLITDQNNCVRRVLLLTPKNCAQLCTFFGRQKTNDIILSHIITFLNDKNDFKLRISFFDNIVIIASYLGVQCSAILHPLLQHGLCDVEEIIIAKTITSIAHLVEQGLIAKNVIIELLREIMPLIYHPNLWITNALIHFLNNLQQYLPMVDLNTKVLPILQQFFNKLNIEYFSIQLFHRRSLKHPIPRHIYETILMAKDQEILISFFNLLEKKLSKPNYDQSLLKMNTIYNRLLADNISTMNEQQIYLLRDLLLKIYRNRRNYNTLMRDDDFTMTSSNNHANMNSDRESLTNFIYRKHYDYERVHKIQLCQSFNTINNNDYYEISSSSANQEWLHMFGPNTNNTDNINSNNNSMNMIDTLTSSSSTLISNQHNHHITNMRHYENNNNDLTLPLRSSLLRNDNVNNNDFLYYECPPYTRDIQLLEQHKKNNFIPFTPIVNKYSTFSSNIIRPMGYLVAHLYEHKSSVNQMTNITKTNLFVTCSDDGSIRLWDLCDDPSRYIISRSKYQYRLEYSAGQPVNFKGIVNCGSFIIAYSNDCQIHVFQLNDTQLQSICSFKVGSIRSTIALYITSICQLSEQMFAVSLSDSWMYIYDIRYLFTPFFNVPVMKISIPPSHRCITSIDGDQLALFAATSLGYILGLDLRFHLKIFKVVHNTNEPTRIAQLKHTPIGLFTSVYGNYDITHWDLNLLSKNRILNASNSVKNCDSSSSSSSGAVVNAILPLLSSSSSSSQAIISAGSDHRIRYWDLVKPEQSYVISDPSYKSCNYCFLNQSTTTKYYFNHHQTQQQPHQQQNSMYTIGMNHNYHQHHHSNNTANVYNNTQSRNVSTSPIVNRPRNYSHNTLLNHPIIINQNNSNDINISSSSSSSSLSSTNATLNSNNNSSNNNQNQNIIMPITTYCQIIEDNGITRIIESETSSILNTKKYQEQLHCPMDQQILSYSHQDSITDLITVNQYLVSCGRNGSVKVWR